MSVTRKNIPTFSEDAPWRNRKKAKVINYPTVPKEDKLVTKTIALRGLAALIVVSILIIAFGCVREAMIKNQVAQIRVEPIPAIVAVPEVKEVVQIDVKDNVVIQPEVIPNVTEPIKEVIEPEVTKEEIPTQDNVENNEAIITEEPIVTEPEKVDVPAVVSIDPEDIFIVKGELWEKARIPYKAADNSRLPGIGFINVPVGTEVFAPFDGKIFLRVDYYNDSPSQTIVFTDDMDWQPGMTYRDEWHYLSFRAKEFSIDNISNRFKKGEVIAVVNSMDIIIKGLTKENYNFIVTISSWWSNLSDSLDPVQYMQELLKDLEK